MATGEIVGKVDLFAEGLGYLEWGDLPWPGELPEFLERLRSSASFRQVQLMPASRMEAGIIILSAFLTGTASIHFLTSTDVAVSQVALGAPRLWQESVSTPRSGKGRHEGCWSKVGRDGCRKDGRQLCAGKSLRS